MSQEPQTSSFLSWPIITLILAVVAGMGWWFVLREEAPPAVAVVSPSRAEVGKNMPPTKAAPVIVPTAIPEAPPAPATVPREDEEKIHAWLTTIDDTNEIAAAILAGWKQLSEPGKTAAAPHLLNLVTDERFDAVGEILLDPATNSEVKDIFFAGILNRGDAVKWPLIVRVMEQKNHPHSQEARNMLTVVLRKDLGDDWPAWRELVQSELLKQNQQ